MSATESSSAAPLSRGGSKFDVVVLSAENREKKKQSHRTIVPRHNNKDLTS
jgi:hypothetical protein